MVCEMVEHVDDRSKERFQGMWGLDTWEFDEYKILGIQMPEEWQYSPGMQNKKEQCTLKRKKELGVYHG